MKRVRVGYRVGCILANIGYVALLFAQYPSNIIIVHAYLPQGIILFVQLISVGTVRYQVFTASETASANNRRKKATEEGNQRDIISEYIRESQNTDFIGKWALLVEWSDVHPYDHQFFSIFPFFFEGETAEFLSSVRQ